MLKQKENNIFHFRSKIEYSQLLATISKLIEYDKAQIIEAREIIKN